MSEQLGEHSYSITRLQTLCSSWIGLSCASVGPQHTWRQVTARHAVASGCAELIDQPIIIDLSSSSSILAKCDAKVFRRLQGAPINRSHKRNFISLSQEMCRFLGIFAISMAVYTLCFIKTGP